jgi:hypothetical protein
MRIYYYGELIEDLNETKTIEQTKLILDETNTETISTQSIGDILQELDLYNDVYPYGLSSRMNSSRGLHNA